MLDPERAKSSAGGERGCGTRLQRSRDERWNPPPSAGGTSPPNPGEFIDSAAVERVLADLSGRADLVLIDSAPMLGIGDALTLASKVDALILVTRLNVVRRPMLRELERVLASCGGRPLGIVVTGAKPHGAPTGTRTATPKARAMCAAVGGASDPATKSREFQA